MNILFEDSQLLVCYKPAGLAVQNRRPGVMDLESEARNHLAASSPGRIPYLGIINRLDQPVEGIVLLAKTKEAAAKLTQALQNGQIQKHYLAVTGKSIPPAEGRLTDYLLKDKGTNLSRVVSRDTPGARKAELVYKVLPPDGSVQCDEAAVQAAEGSLVQIRLITGRHHQIRVQMAHAGMPLLGDLKYGNAADSPAAEERVPLALCAYHMVFSHPRTGKEMDFTICPRGAAFKRCCK